MKGITKALIAGTIVTGGSGTVGKAYDTFAPKTAEDGFNGKGIKKASSEQEYRGIFEENKDSVNSLNINELSTNSSTADAAKKLKEGCENKLNKPIGESSGETIIKFCELKISTVKGLLANHDTKEFITQDNDYKVSLFFLKHSNDGKTKVKENNNLTHEDLKNGCIKQLNKKISETDKSVRGAINLFCKIPEIKTIEKLIQKNRSNGNIISEDTEGQNRFEKGKYTAKVIELLKAHNSQENSSLSSNTDKETGGPKLKDGCEKGKNKSLSEDIEDSFINHIRVVCSSTVE